MQDSALACYRKALAADSTVKGFFKNYEQIVLGKKLEMEAITVIEKAITVSEADMQSFIALGNIYKKKKKQVWHSWYYPATGDRKSGEGARS